MSEGALVDAPFLFFRLGTAVFGVPALAVRSIHALPALSPLQETAPFIVGVFNLRGTIVPVMDLNARFGLEPPPYRLDDNLIVLNWGGAEIAILVNEARAVERIPPEQIEAAPLHSRRHDLPEPFIAGVAQIDDGIVMLLHLPHLLRWATPPTSAPEVQGIAARRFEAQQWTEAERAVLQERAARLRGATDERDEQGQGTAEQTPVAVIALGGEEFGIELDEVREFASVSAVSTVPCCPPHILGQINLRGDIVTLVDVRQTLRTARTTPKFFESGKPPSAQNAQNPNATTNPAPRNLPVVVVQHEGAPVGIVVDELRGVLYLREDERRALDTGAQSAGHGKFFDGAALHEGRLLPLLDIARLFDEGGLSVDEGA